MNDELRTPAIRPPRLVVVDDDPAVCNSLKFALELEGFTVKTYSSGFDLLATKDLDSVDCFVIDQTIPGLSGLQLIEILRTRGNTKPAILIATDLRHILANQAAKLGIPIVEKPLLGDALIERIRTACATR